MYTTGLRRGSQLIYFSCPFPARRGRPRGGLLAGKHFRRAFPGLGDRCGNILALLFKRDMSNVGVVNNILAVVNPYLKPQNDIEHQRKEETRQNKGVLNLCGGRKQPREAAKDLRHHCKGGQLPCRLCPVVLYDLGKLGE